jgi:hypothetical protein
MMTGTDCISKSESRLQPEHTKVTRQLKLPESFRLKAEL